MVSRHHGRAEVPNLPTRSFERPGDLDDELAA
jgi:hypothetical protein